MIFEKFTSPCVWRLLWFAILVNQCLHGEINSVPENLSLGISQQDIDQADIIVIASPQKEKVGFFESSAQVQMTTPQGPVQGEVFQTRLNVIKAIKGNPDKVINAKFYVPNTIVNMREWSIALGRPVLFLLKRSVGDNVYELERQPYSWMILSNEMLSSNSDGATDYIKQLVGNILKAGFAEPTFSQLADLQMSNGDTKTLGQYYAQESDFGTLQALRTVASMRWDSPEVRASLRGLWSASNDSIKMKALEISVNLRDNSAVAFCVQEWKSAPEGSSLRLNLQNLLVLTVNRMNPNDLTALGPYIESDIPGVRGAALLNLQNAKTPAFLPIFIKALNDSDYDVEYHAMLGIYYLDPDLIKEENIPVPGIKLFKLQPAHYISLWKSWLTNGGLSKLRSDLNLK